jgi:hypothetical protein
MGKINHAVKENRSAKKLKCFMISDYPAAVLYNNQTFLKQQQLTEK